MFFGYFLLTIGGEGKELKFKEVLFSPYYLLRGFLG
jgi:hypothetical protein